MDNDNQYVASWLQTKLAAKPEKQTDEQRYLTALYHCGEAWL